MEILILSNKFLLIKKLIFLFLYNHNINTQTHKHKNTPTHKSKMFQGIELISAEEANKRREQYLKKQEDEKKALEERYEKHFAEEVNKFAAAFNKAEFAKEFYIYSFAHCKESDFKKYVDYLTKLKYKFTYAKTEDWQLDFNSLFNPYRELGTACFTLHIEFNC